MNEYEETARLFFETSRADAHSRTQLRDGILLAFLTVTAAIFGVVLTKDAAGSKDALLIVPYLAFGAACLLAQHNLTIHALSRYQIDELRKFLGDGKTQPPLWESSQSLRSLGKDLLSLTLVGQIVILIVPSALALFLVPCHEEGLLRWGQLVGACLMGLTISVLGYVFLVRCRHAHSQKPEVKVIVSSAQTANPANGNSLLAGGEVRKDLAIKYLLDTTARFGTYHHHKETSAWAGIVLFGVLVSQFIRVNAPESTSSPVKWVLTVGVACIGTVVCMYLKRQFLLRSHAADVVAACSRLSAKLMADHPDKGEAMDWTPKPGADERENRELRNLPTCILNTVREVQNEERDSRRVLEFVGYALVIATTLFAFNQVRHLF